MLDDMTTTYGAFGSSTSSPTVGSAPIAPPPTNRAISALVETDEDPIFVPADVYYNGKTWYRVGIRFKGNSSLQTSWGVES